MKNNNWSPRKSREFYNIQTWGNGYFDINNAGQINVRKNKYSVDKPVTLIDIINLAKEQYSVQTPLILRFNDIIKGRANRIIKAFMDKKKALEYSGSYTLIYPIKVNQNKTVIDSFLSLNNSVRGLEAGSKAELIGVLSSIKDTKTPIICNGYKDRSYIKLALIAKKSGYNITIVIEKMLEAKYVIEESKILEVEPLLGVRFRLALTLAGKWAHSGGEKSKFGLNTTQVLELIQRLKDNKLLHCLNLLHCHQGSQIANIKDIGHYINELTMTYVGLCKIGVPLKTIDIGGGLAVDYEGSRSRSFNSTNYSIGDYAETILSNIKTICTDNNVAIPNVFSESGRAVVAHHAVFISNIVELERVVGEEVPEVKVKDEDLLELAGLYDSFNKIPINEIYSSAVVAMDSLHNRFTEGKLSLAKRAIAEQLFSHIKLNIFKNLNQSYRSHRELYDFLDEDLAKKIIVNFSLFQSMPDVWAIDQRLPIMPITHLNQEPTMRAIIEDITCDSDGKISRYTDYQGDEPSLKLPPFNEKDPYLLAVFLIGAYQEIMGNMHNLFGPVTTINVSLNAKGTFIIERIHDSFKNADSLNHVGFNIDEICKAFDKRIKQIKLPLKTQTMLLSQVKEIIESHTYLS